jgi:hypothetical protein
MKAAADITFDQALQAALTVRVNGENGRVTLPMPEAGSRCCSSSLRCIRRYARRRHAKSSSKASGHR